ncbi:hypothetical protein WJX84_009021 [Apatococcus fuscideae]|uniref:HNH nuclease domain-containing protein n=1 Tax=Apatococcus fuscideae TaxID=2026836 RepID=A0AAW1TAL7_9CHLO
MQTPMPTARGVRQARAGMQPAAGPSSAGGEQGQGRGSGVGAAFRRRVEVAARAALQARDPQGQTVAALAAQLQEPPAAVRAALEVLQNVQEDEAADLSLMIEDDFFFDANTGIQDFCLYKFAFCAQQPIPSIPFLPLVLSPGGDPEHSNEYHFDRIAMDSSGRLDYQGRRLTPTEAAALRSAWECRYPKAEHANTLGNGRESVSHRRNITTKAQVRQACWSALVDLDGSEAIRAVEPRLAELFRCDAYGNVVSIQASGSAVCAFEADHIFPWSRGGLSVSANLMAVHWGANRFVKNAKIPNALTDAEVERLQCGLSVQIFLHMYSKRSHVPRTKLSLWDAHFQTLLLRTYAVPWELAPLITSDNALELLGRAHQAALDDITS